MKKLVLIFSILFLVVFQGIAQKQEVIKCNYLLVYKQDSIMNEYQIAYLETNVIPEKYESYYMVALYKIQETYNVEKVYKDIQKQVIVKEFEKFNLKLE